MTPTDIDTAADGLARDWENRAPYRALSGAAAPGDIEAAYAIQRAVQARMAEWRGPVAGRKIALSSRPMQQMLGIDHPIAGAIFAGDIHASPATVALSGFRHLGLECELAVELGVDVLPGTHDAASVAGLIVAARPAFELIEDKGADYNDLDILTLIADNAWCGGVVLGPAIPLAGRDLADMPAMFHQDGADPEAANTGAADPLGSLAWVLNLLGRQGITARKGEIVITGSVVRTRFPRLGDHFRYDIDGHVVELALS